MSDLRIKSENPYRLAGQIAAGNRFIGREELVQQLQSVWSSAGRPSNLRVQGHHRIGKSSIVQRALDTSRSRSDLLTVHLNIGRHDSGTDVFRAMTRRAMSALREVAATKNLLSDLASKDAAVQRATEWYDLMEAVLAFFSTLGQAGLYVLLVLDEFDRASTVFGHLAEFQLIRDLASEDEYPLGLVTVSRRDIESIEISTAGGSVLGGVASLPLYVGMFTEAEADLMLSRAASLGIALGSVREQVTRHCGGHPLLLEILCHGLVEVYHRTKELDVELAYQPHAPAFERQFCQLQKSIDEETEGRGTALLKRISANGAAEIFSPDLARLKLMGVTIESGSALKLFCEGFSRYIAMSG